jgi:hypothetical protein
MRLWSLVVAELGKHFCRTLPAPAAACANAQSGSEFVHGPSALEDALPDFPLGNRVADANIHLGFASLA